MPIRNNKSHRITEANQRKTQAIIEAYRGKLDLHETWEKHASADLQDREHDYILELRRNIRNRKNYIMHRGSADANL